MPMRQLCITGKNQDPGKWLNPADIDAHWLQRAISKAFGFTDSDAAESLELSEEVFKALATDDDRDCENALVSLLDYDKFDLIKVLLKNRFKVPEVPLT